MSEQNEEDEDVVTSDLNLCCGKPITSAFSFVLRVLKATAFHYCEDIFWRCDDKYAPLTFFAHCHDVFDWGTSDGERITPENVHILERSLQESRDYGVALFCARVRGRRPQDTFIKSIRMEQERALFEACGPVRENNIANPKMDRRS